ncbi:NAD-dependent epimerase/dehydratase family protein [Muricauda sp. TY007]|nr:NAD-dependent epimerase/dehydratase family protein [Muricauda sp. TY007]
MKTAFLIGGSGYIGSNILKVFLEKNKFEKYLVYDIKPLLGFEEYIDKGIVVYKNVDVRCNLPDIDFDIDPKETWLFNLAAIHREPGHEFREYFDTNIPGAKNVVEFAKKYSISNIFFTSSIAPYGKSLAQTTENSPLYPETGYGISKALAEEIHKNWAVKDKTRRLIIVRPSVIYGPHDPGNVYRMIKALKKGTFILPNGGNVIKAYGYIYGLVDSIEFTMAKKEKSLIIYNYAENPLLTLNQMTKAAKAKLGYSKPTISLSVMLLSFLARLIQIGSKLIGKESEIHPVRVRKAGFPTNIKPLYLIQNDFDFKYGFEKSLDHWISIAPEDFSN